MEISPPNREDAYNNHLHSKHVRLTVRRHPALRILGVVAALDGATLDEERTQVERGGGGVTLTFALKMLDPRATRARSPQGTRYALFSMVDQTSSSLLTQRIHSAGIIVTAEGRNAVTLRDGPTVLNFGT